MAREIELILGDITKHNNFDKVIIACFDKVTLRIYQQLLNT